MVVFKYFHVYIGMGRLMGKSFNVVSILASFVILFSVLSIIPNDANALTWQDYQQILAIRLYDNSTLVKEILSGDGNYFINRNYTVDYVEFEYFVGGPEYIGSEDGYFNMVTFNPDNGTYFNFWNWNDYLADEDFDPTDITWKTGEILGNQVIDGENYYDLVRCVNITNMSYAITFEGCDYLITGVLKVWIDDEWITFDLWENSRLIWFNPLQHIPDSYAGISGFVITFVWVLIIFLPALILSPFLGKVGFISGIAIMTFALWMSDILDIWVLITMMIGVVVLVFRGDE